MNPGNPGDEDQQVDITVEREVDYWATRLGVPRLDFCRAAEQAGPRIGDIRQHLVGGFNPSGPSS